MKGFGDLFSSLRSYLTLFYEIFFIMLAFFKSFDKIVTKNYITENFHIKRRPYMYDPQ